MPLDKDILGTAIYNNTKQFNDVPVSAANMEATRLAQCKAIAQAIIDHLKAAGVISVTVATTGSATAQTGTGTGTIS